MSRDEAQRRVDEIHSEMNELWRHIREKEAELDKYDRIANPDDYK